MKKTWLVNIKILQGSAVTKTILGGLPYIPQLLISYSVETGEPPHIKTSVAICNAQVELVESFVYLGSAQHRNGNSDTEIRRRIAIQ